MTYQPPHVLLVYFLTFIALSPGYAQDRPATSDHSQKNIARELENLKQTISRLEAKLDKLAEQPSEFSRVEIRVVDEEGQPVSGFKIQLTSSAAARRAKASGVSNETGTAMTRFLPYGEYRMSASGNGWHAGTPVTVEVGNPLDLTVVAPSSDRFGELVLHSSLQPNAVRDLRFGGWKVQQQNDGWGTLIAPEPGKSDPDEIPKGSLNAWRTFPTVADGIEVVGVLVECNVERRVAQPAGNTLTWQWRPTSPDALQPQTRWFIQSDGRLRPVLNTEEKQKSITNRATHFRPLAPEPDAAAKPNDGRPREKSLGYVNLKFGDEQHDQASIRLPAGQVELSIKGLYGRPSSEVLQAIGEPAESEAGELWLPSVIAGKSKWFDRLLGESKTTATQFSMSRRSVKPIELAAGESTTLRIGTADSASVDD